MTTESVFVDTNVFLYARDDREPSKQAATARWLSVLADRGVPVVSPEVPGGCPPVTLGGKLPITADAARQATLKLEASSQGSVDLEWIRLAWSLRRETAFQWWARATLGAAVRAGCRSLPSEDFQHGRALHGIPILTPFTVGPEAVGADH